MPDSTVWLKRSTPLSAETQPPRVSKDITILNIAKRKNVFLARSNRINYFLAHIPGVQVKFVSLLNWPVKTWRSLIWRDHFRKHDDQMNSGIFGVPFAFFDARQIASVLNEYLSRTVIGDKQSSLPQFVSTAQFKRLQFYRQSSAFFTDERCHLSVDSVEGSPSDDYSPKTETDQPPFGPFEGCVPMWRVIVGFTSMLCSAFMIGNTNRLCSVLGVVLFIVGSLIWLTGHTPGNCQQASNTEQYGQYQELHIPPQQSTNKT